MLLYHSGLLSLEVSVQQLLRGRQQPMGLSMSVGLHLICHQQKLVPGLLTGQLLYQLQFQKTETCCIYVDVVMWGSCRSNKRLING